MSSSSLAAGLSIRALILAAAFVASAAMAQPEAAPSATTPPMAPGTTAADVAPAPGLPGPLSVDPAPGATGPYADHSKQAFYDVDNRISRYQQRAETNLSGVQQKRAMSEIASIRSEEKSQIARHGSLLDWARENLNHRLDQLKQTYPALAG
jgi:hypothetical protein